MPRPLVPLSILVASMSLVACGSQGIQLAENDPDYAGARIFEQRCGACHTLAAAGTEGSAVSVNSREYKDGPNFNQRTESRAQVLYAIRNGGYSSSPMPQDIVVGKEAEQVAAFLSKYAGKEASP
jgi:mono/diheme cytochrome c family protein